MHKLAGSLGPGRLAGYGRGRLMLVLYVADVACTVSCRPVVTGCGLTLSTALAVVELRAAVMLKLLCMVIQLCRLSAGGVTDSMLLLCSRIGRRTVTAAWLVVLPDVPKMAWLSYLLGEPGANALPELFRSLRDR